MNGLHQAPTLPQRKRRRGSPKLWALGIVAVFLILFVALNSQQVKVNLIFGSARLPLIFALLIAAGLGALLGWAGPRIRRRPPD